MNAVFLAALQDFFSNGSTANLIMVDTFKMGCHEGCPRGIVHCLHNIRNVHDDMSAYIEFVSAGVHDNNLRVPAVYISAYAAVPDGVTCQIADRFSLMTQHIAASVTC